LASATSVVPSWTRLSVAVIVMKTSLDSNAAGVISALVPLIVALTTAPMLVSID